jgi:hypothetical protein
MAAKVETKAHNHSFADVSNPELAPQTQKQTQKEYHRRVV